MKDKESWFVLGWFLKNEDNPIKCFNNFMAWKDKDSKAPKDYLEEEWKEFIEE